MQRPIWERRIRDILLSIHCFITTVLCQGKKGKKNTFFLAQFYNELCVRKSNVFSPHCTANKIKTNPITVLWRYATLPAWCHFELGDNSYMGELSKHHTGEPQWQGKTYTQIKLKNCFIAVLFILIFYKTQRNDRTHTSFNCTLKQTCCTDGSSNLRTTVFPLKCK